MRVLKIEYYIHEQIKLKAFKEFAINLSKLMGPFYIGLYIIFMLSYFFYTKYSFFPYNYLSKFVTYQAFNNHLNQILLFLIEVIGLSILYFLIFVLALVYKISPYLIVKRFNWFSKNHVGRIILELKDNSIIIQVNKNKYCLEKKKILSIEQLDDCYFLWTRMKYYIVIPNKSGIKFGEEESHYGETLKSIIGALKPFAKFRPMIKEKI